MWTAHRKARRPGVPRPGVRPPGQPRRLHPGADDRRRAGSALPEGGPALIPAEHPCLRPGPLPLWPDSSARGPRCNIRCGYCDRRYDWAPTSPGPASLRRSSPQRLPWDRVERALRLDSRLRVAGVAGPGEPGQPRHPGDPPPDSRPLSQTPALPEHQRAGSV